MHKRASILWSIRIFILSVIVFQMAFPAHVLAIQLANVHSTNTTCADNSASEKIEITCQYPSISSYSGQSYVFDVGILYSGAKDPKVFDIKVSVPEGFNYSVAPGYGDGKEIAAIRLDPNKGYADSIKLTVSPSVWTHPVPGEYPVSFELSSGDIKSEINLKAIVTAEYEINITTPDERLNTEVTAGQNSTFVILINNTGSTDMANIKMGSVAGNRPAGWTVSFKPETLDSLKVGESKEIQVTLNAPEKTISGDYMLTLSAAPESNNAYDNINMRVTVMTSTIWGWVGVGIVILVIVALSIMFIRFGRR